MKYCAVELREEFQVKRIISIHYFEYMNDFIFAGESHNFWEFLCVDKGMVDITADREHITLQRGNIIFHKPNEFHAVASDGTIAPNLVVISFECGDPAMSLFANQILNVDESERGLIAQILSEARANFSGGLDDPYMEQLTRNDSPPFGSEQLIKIHLEHLMIHLYRKYFVETMKHRQDAPLELDDELYQTILLYFEQHLTEPMSIRRICQDNLISPSQLKRLFSRHSGSGILERFNAMKIEYAKQLIRNQKYNYTQIADQLGYGSIHYFSRQFKQLTGMTPSEYTASIKQLSERPLRKSR